MTLRDDLYRALTDYVNRMSRDRTFIEYYRSWVREEASKIDKKALDEYERTGYTYNLQDVFPRWLYRPLLDLSSYYIDLYNFGKEVSFALLDEYPELIAAIRETQYLAKDLTPKELRMSARRIMHLPINQRYREAIDRRLRPQPRRTS